MTIHRFHGGLSLAGHKAESTAGVITPCPLPAQLQISMLQHSGEPALPCVEIGDYVQRGQRIGAINNDRGAVVHSPAAGTVVALSMQRAAALNLPSIMHVIIDVDQTNTHTQTMRFAPLDPTNTAVDALLERIRDAGIVGLGGAGFPSADKLSIQRKTLILNGAECEPYISCDDRLLRESAEQVLHGGQLLGRIVGAQEIILAIEDRMPQALQACEQALTQLPDCPVQLRAVPTIYPAGGERQLIYTLTGLEVPSGGLPREIGVLVHNVGTAVAIWQAAVEGEALTERIVTVTGPGVAKPGNYRVAIGTPIAHLIACAGGYTERAQRLIHGGPMTGIALPDDSFTIGKTSNCVLVLDAQPLRTDAAAATPCIRCGECARVCPAQLLPQQLHWTIGAQQWNDTRELGVFDCIECGGCDLVCPSHIALTDQFRYAKSELRHRDRSQQQADAARERFESRNQRLERIQTQRQAQRQQHNSSVANAAANALARAKAKREQSSTPASSNKDTNDHSSGQS